MTTDGGNVEITSTKTDDLESPESPIIPSVIGEKTSYTSGSQNSGSGSENENPSADDERSRDGDRQRKLDVDDQEASSSSNLVDCTPRTRKKVEHFRQGLAARRIQRTWKHFYEELEERKEVRDELPAPLVQGNFRHFTRQIVQYIKTFHSFQSLEIRPNWSPRQVRRPRKAQRNHPSQPLTRKLPSILLKNLFWITQEEKEP